MATAGAIPQSNALAEAGSGADALAELSRRASDIMSLSPEVLTDVELDSMIGALIEHRHRLEAAAGAKPTRQRRIATEKADSKPPINGEDMGL